MGQISDADDFVEAECLGHTFAVGRIGIHSVAGVANLDLLFQTLVCASLTPERLMKLVEMAQTAGSAAEPPWAILHVAVELPLCAVFT